MSCCDGEIISKKGGDLASSVTNKALADANRCAVAAAIIRVRNTSKCEGCLPVKPGFGQATSESSRLEKEIAACETITSQDARFIVNQGLRGVPQSVRIALLQQETIANYAPRTDPLRRLAIYNNRPNPNPCGPPPAEILNANLPKASQLSCVYAQLPFYLRPTLS